MWCTVRRSVRLVFTCPRVFFSAFRRSSHRTEVFVYAAVGAVAALVLLVCVVFIRDVRRFGLVVFGRAPDDASHEFFHSFTGSVMYGHGHPRNVAKPVKLLAALLADTLLLPVSMRLLQTLACEYPSGDPPHLRSDPDMACWRGDHARLAAIALTALAVFVPLAVLLAPTLMALPSLPSRANLKVLHNRLSFAKPFVMASSLFKSLLLVVVLFGPDTAAFGLWATLAANAIMLGMCAWWFNASVRRVVATVAFATSAGTRPRPAVPTLAPEPSVFPGASMVRLASYLAACWSSVVLLVGDAESFVDRQNVMAVLAAGWVTIAVVVGVAHAVWRRGFYNVVHGHRRFGDAARHVTSV